MIIKAEQKEEGIELKQVCDILTSFSDNSLKGIKRTQVPDINKIHSDLEK